MLKTIARYFLSFFKTCLVLIQHRPAVIFTLNQPAPLVLTIYLFTKLVGGAYILDSHSAPFNDPKLRWLLPAYRFFASKALLNINTNSYHQKLVESWGGKSIIISDIPIEFNLKLPSVKVSPKSIAYVASFDFDEPLQEVIAAARQLPDVTFHVTGNLSRAPIHIINAKPPNVIFEGFLSRNDFLRLIKSVKAVMTLTTRNYTMQRAGYEALSLEKPIITSDWPILRESFGGGAVFVQNRADSIYNGICELLKNHHQYCQCIAIQRKERKEAFDLTRNEILSEIQKLENGYSI